MGFVELVKLLEEGQERLYTKGERKAGDQLEEALYHIEEAASAVTGVPFPYLLGAA